MGRVGIEYEDKKGGQCKVTKQHTHSSEKVNRQLRQIHVGLDVWGLQAAPINDIADTIRLDA